MVKATKPLGGASKDKYFRDLFDATPGLEPTVAQALKDATKGEITQVRVRLPVPERAAAARKGKARARETAPTPAAASAFDPYAFSAVVVLKRQGKDALQALLDAIADPAELRLLADKQHLAVPPEPASADALRRAIVAGAEARMADRRAAAS